MDQAGLELGQPVSDGAKQFVAVLEANGQLADVEEGEDTSLLPAKVTHVRYPDGRIERIRFTGFR